MHSFETHARAASVSIKYLQHVSSTNLVWCVGRIGSSIDGTTTYDTEHKNRIIDAVEGMHQHCVSLPYTSVLEPGNQLSNQHLRLCRGDRVVSIVGVNVNLRRSVERIYQGTKIFYEDVMVELGIIVGPGENVLVGYLDMRLGEQRHVEVWSLLCGTVHPISSSA